MVIFLEELFTHVFFSTTYSCPAISVPRKQTIYAPSDDTDMETSFVLLAGSTSVSEHLEDIPRSRVHPTSSRSQTVDSKQKLDITTPVCATLVLAAIVCILLALRKLSKTRAAKKGRRESMIIRCRGNVGIREDILMRSVYSDHIHHCACADGCDVECPASLPRLPPCYCVAVDMPRPTRGSRKSCHVVQATTMDGTHTGHCTIMVDVSDVSRGQNCPLRCPDGGEASRTSDNVSGDQLQRLPSYEEATGDGEAMFSDQCHCHS